jgi:glutamate-1-semialdehyde 2,1-aminomutase
MWTIFFADRPIRSWDDAKAVNRERYARFFRAMLARNILLPPSPFEAAFLSLAHDAAVIDETVEAATGAFHEAVA